MEAIVFARNGQALTTSEIVASNTGNAHASVLKLLRNHKDDFETFGPLGFEIRKGKPLPQGGFAKATEFAILNEQQATLLVTYCKNTEVVRKFKVALVKAFYEMREKLHPTVTCPIKSQLPPPVLTEQQAYAIMSEVAKRAKRDGSKYQTIYRALKARYQVTKYTNILQRDFDDAVEFIRAVNLRTPVAHDAEPEEEGVWVPVSYIKRQQQFVYEMRYLFRECFTKFHRFLQLVDSPLSGRFYEMYTSLNLVGIENELSKLGYPVSDLVNFKRTPRPNAYIGR